MQAGRFLISRNLSPHSEKCPISTARPYGNEAQRPAPQSIIQSDLATELQIVLGPIPGPGMPIANHNTYSERLGIPFNGWLQLRRDCRVDPTTQGGRKDRHRRWHHGGCHARFRRPSDIGHRGSGGGAYCARRTSPLRCLSGRRGIFDSGSDRYQPLRTFDCGFNSAAFAPITFHPAALRSASSRVGLTPLTKLAPASIVRDWSL